MALKVGDKLPDSFWTQAHLTYTAGKASKQNLSQYKGKVLVLDFWASWCSSCLKKWPMLDSVQRLYPDQVKIMLVNETRNGDDLSKIRPKMDRSPITALESIYADTLLANQFPHRLLPHYVWISEKGTVMAITGADFMQQSIIKRLLTERSMRQTKPKTN